MTSFAELTPEQSATLELLVHHGVTYDELAQILQIDGAAVRERALAAVDALCPGTELASAERALITDYVLGQLSGTVRSDVRDRLARSEDQSTWARTVSERLTPAVIQRLPASPDGVAGATSALQTLTPGDPDERPVTHRGVLTGLGIVAVAAVAATIVVLTHSGARRGPAPASTAGLSVGARTTAVPSAAAAIATSTGAVSSTSTSTVSSGSTATSRAAVRVITRAKLIPSAAPSNVTGVVEVLGQGTSRGLLIGARHVPANRTHPPDAYAVWLYNSPQDAHMLGFVSPKVTRNGRLTTAGAVPANAARYRSVIVTLETRSNPTAPGRIILRGTPGGL